VERLSHQSSVLGIGVNRQGGNEKKPKANPFGLLPTHAPWEEDLDCHIRCRNARQAEESKTMSARMRSWSLRLKNVPNQDRRCTGPRRGSCSTVSERSSSCAPNRATEAQEPPARMSAGQSLEHVRLNEYFESTLQPWLKSSTV
jgi:hypothetical protein